MGHLRVTDGYLSPIGSKLSCLFIKSVMSEYLAGADYNKLKIIQLVVFIVWNREDYTIAATAKMILS